MALDPGKLSLYRKRLTNPGRRSTIPNAYLKRLDPRLYGVRQQNVANAKRTAQNNVLYDPMASLNGSQIYSLAKREAGLAYDPAISSAQQDRRLAIVNDAALAERVAGYNQMASSALAHAHEAAQTGATDLASKLAATNAGLQNSITNEASNAQQFAAQDAQLRGGDLSGGMSQRLAADFQQQRAGIAANAAAQENAGNTSAQGWAGLISMMQGAQAIQGADTLSQIRNASANREAGIGKQITDLQAQKGLSLTKGITDLRQSEFEKQAAIQTLDIKGQTARTAANKAAFDAKFKVAKFKADQAYRKADHDLKVLTQRQAHGDRSAALTQKIKEAQVRQREAARRLDIAQGNLDNARTRTGIQAAKIPKADEVKGQWLPPVAQAHAISDFHRLQGDPVLRKMKQDGKTRQEAADAILTSDKWGKLDPALISAALDMVYVGHISPGTAAKLHRSKVKVSGLGVPVRTPGVVIHKRKPTNVPGGPDPRGVFK